VLAYTGYVAVVIHAQLDVPPSRRRKEDAVEDRGMSFTRQGGSTIAVAVRHETS